MSQAVLLDTHALLWWMMDDPQLPTGLRQRLADPTQEVLVSAASVWEIGIKARRGRLQGVGDYLAEHGAWHRQWGFREAAITAVDGRMAGGFPFAHADPFDRVLMAQSVRLSALLATCDRAIMAVHEQVYWE